MGMMSRSRRARSTKNGSATGPITAAVMNGSGQPLALRTVSLERPRPLEVRMRLVACGVCHTDIMYRDHWPNTPTPLVLGHEGAGVVEEVGGKVKSVRPDDHVVLSFTLEQLAPLGCGLQTGAGAVLNSLGVKRRDSFACFGAGTVGLAGVMAAKVVGAYPIIAVDMLESRLQMAKELGATHTVNARETNVAEAIRNIVAAGVDYVLETTGSQAIFQHAIECLGGRGTCGCVASGANAERSFDMRQLLGRGKKVMGIVEGDAVPQTFIPELLRLHRKGHFPFEKLLTFYPLEDINRAFEDSKRGIAIKPVIRLAPAGAQRLAPLCLTSE